MRAKPSGGYAFLAGTALIVLAVLVSIPAGADELVYKASADYCAEVNGAYAPDARFFTTDTAGKFLIDIPSLPMSALVNLKTKKAVPIPPTSITHEPDESSVRFEEPTATDTPTITVSIDGEVSRFQSDASEVRILKASKCRSTAPPPVRPAASIKEDPAARKCLHKEERPLANTAGCTKTASLKNSCDAQVVAVVRSTQHLFSGTLPATSTVVLPPGAEVPLGCVWPSGAMAPTVYEVLTAGFPPKQNEAGNRAAPGP